MPTTYDLIQTQTLTSSAGIVTFSSIPQTYTDLVFKVTASVTSATYDIAAIRVNSVTTGYGKVYMESGPSSATSGYGSAEISLRAAYMPGTNYSGKRSADEYHFFNYSNSNVYKTVLARCNFPDYTTNFAIQTQASHINTTGAITQITIQTANGANLASGSTFSLYGIKAL